MLLGRCDIADAADTKHKLLLGTTYEQMVDGRSLRLTCTYTCTHASTRKSKDRDEGRERRKVIRREQMKGREGRNEKRGARKNQRRDDRDVPRCFLAVANDLAYFLIHSLKELGLTVNEGRQGSVQGT